jgi:hypothetical protein
MSMCPTFFIGIFGIVDIGARCLFCCVFCAEIKMLDFNTTSYPALFHPI